MRDLNYNSIIYNSHGFNTDSNCYNNYNILSINFYKSRQYRPLTTPRTDSKLALDDLLFPESPREMCLWWRLHCFWDCGTSDKPAAWLIPSSFRDICEIECTRSNGSSGARLKLIRVSRPNRAFYLCLMANKIRWYLDGNSSTFNEVLDMMEWTLRESPKLGRFG